MVALEDFFLRCVFEEIELGFSNIFDSKWYLNLDLN